MDKRESNFILEAVNVLSSRNDDRGWEGLITDAKRVLDARFGPEWNILVGKSVGYSMKTKKKSSVILASSTGEVMLCWKSPGFEVEDAHIVKIKAGITIAEKDSLLEESNEKKGRLNIIECPEADSPEYTVDTQAAVQILEAVMDEIKDMDHQGAARHIRNKYVTPRSPPSSSHHSLTARLGTVWHVAVGQTREFQIQPAKNCTDHIIAAVKKGGIKIEIFRHKQESPTGIEGLSMPSLSTVAEILPSLLFVFLCIAFIVQNSSICIGDTGRLSKITRGLCSVTNTFSLAPLAGVLFVMTVLKQVRKGMARKQKRTAAASQ